MSNTYSFVHQLLQNNKAKTGEKTNAAHLWSKNMSRSIHTWRDTETASQYLTKEGSEQLNSWIIVFALPSYIYTVAPKIIQPADRLFLFLLYLATGESCRSLDFMTLLPTAHSTFVHDISPIHRSLEYQRRKEFEHAIIHPSKIIQPVASITCSMLSLIREIPLDTLFDRGNSPLPDRYPRLSPVCVLIIETGCVHA
jgi:hypothetical protein